RGLTTVLVALLLLGATTPAVAHDWVEQQPAANSTGRPAGEILESRPDVFVRSEPAVWTIQGYPDTTRRGELHIINARGRKVVQRDIVSCPVLFGGCPDGRVFTIEWHGYRDLPNSDRRPRVAPGIYRATAFIPDHDGELHQVDL